MSQEIKKKTVKKPKEKRGEALTKEHYEIYQQDVKDLLVSHYEGLVDGLKMAREDTETTLKWARELLKKTKERPLKSFGKPRAKKKKRSKV